jgi:hypothetical protein
MDPARRPRADQSLICVGLETTLTLFNRGQYGNYNVYTREETGDVTLFLLAYDAYDEIPFGVPIRRYRVVMKISYLLTFFNRTGILKKQY